MPGRAGRGATEEDLNMYGTTLRVWEPSIQAWRIIWSNPVGHHYEQMFGRWIGEDVVQVGTRFDGIFLRWIFSEIGPDSFRWIGEALNFDGRIWRFEGEFRAQKIS